MGLVTMSPSELDRLALMRRIAERRTTQRMAAEQIGLSVRQVERLYGCVQKRVAPKASYRASAAHRVTDGFRQSSARSR